MNEPRPSPRPARTVAQHAGVKGVGLFTAARSALVVKPAPPGHGIVFVRTDAGSGPIPADVLNLATTPVHPAFASMPARCTGLSADPADTDAPCVFTVEHILAALVGLGITDARIEVDGPEVPIMDGSAKPFVDAMLAAGIREQAGAGPDPIAIGAPMDVEGIELRPGSTPVYAYCIDYGDRSPIKPGWARLTDVGATPESRRAFVEQVAPARTFCLLEEAEAMHRAGLFGHLGYEDMLVLGDDGPIENRLRFDDEPARHKLLDLIGDLALVGRPIAGSVSGEKTGHAQNHAAARAVRAL